MSLLAWQILALFMGETHRLYGGEYGQGYIEAVVLRSMFAESLLYPSPEYESALKELLDLGLIAQESPKERFQLVVKEQP